MKKQLCVLLVLTLALLLGSQSAVALNLTGVDVSYGLPDSTTYGTGWYTDYGFKSDQTGSSYLEAFCVDPEFLNLKYDYELIAVPDSLNAQAVALATEWFHGTRYSGSTKSMYQVAIWTVLGMGSYDGSSDIINSLTESTYAPSGSGALSLARSPIGGNGPGSQDYLIAVPEPGNMLLMGTGLIVLVGIGRRRIFKK